MLKKRMHDKKSVSILSLSIRALLTAALLMVSPLTFVVAAPVNPIKPHKPIRHLGFIATQRALDSHDLIQGAARGWFVRYETTGENDDTVWSNGLIFEPNVPAPRGGYKIITYGHGAKGLPEKCQPTYTHSYNNEVEYRNVTAWLSAGYAVTLTDYPIINGVQPFMGAYSEATSMIDIVRAARKIDPRLSKDILIGGYSLGGQAALAAASIQSSYAPEFHNHGTFTLAAPWGQDMIVGMMGPTSPADQLGLSVVIGLVLAGFKASESQYATLANTYLTNHGIEIINAASTNCLVDGWVIGAALTRPADLFKISIGDNHSLTKVVENYMRTPLMGITGPVFIAQGLNDPFVMPLMAEAIQTGLVDLGNTRTVRKMYPDTDHVNLPEHAANDVLAFIKYNLR